MTTRRSLSALALVTLAGCYGHTRRDAPAPPPEEVKQDMVSIPPGRFTMGDRNGDPAEYPEREITMSGFRIDRTEVTNADYARCVQAKACDPTPYMEDEKLGLPDHPVVGVTWIDAQHFCAWVNKRLPTEAEWEYAARGSDLRKWPWKGIFDPKKANTRHAEDFHGASAPVDAYKDGESPFGVLNMAGNAAEWTADYFDPTWYGTSDQTTNPTGPERGRERVVRGGAYRDASHMVRVSSRLPKSPTESDSTIGFRCAK